MTRTMINVLSVCTLTLAGATQPAFSQQADAKTPTDENLVVTELAQGLAVSYTHLTLPTNREV